MFYFEHLRSPPPPTSPPTSEEQAEEVVKDSGVVDDGVLSGVDEIDPSSFQKATNKPETLKGSIPGVDFGNAWEETFGRHTDKMKKGISCLFVTCVASPTDVNEGPQSIGFDFTFHKAAHVYGIPEHATDLALKDTGYLLPFLPLFVSTPFCQPHQLHFPLPPSLRSLVVFLYPLLIMH